MKITFRNGITVEGSSLEEMESLWQWMQEKEGGESVLSPSMGGNEYKALCATYRERFGEKFSPKGLASDPVEMVRACLEKGKTRAEMAIGTIAIPQPANGQQCPSGEQEDLDGADLY